MFNLSLKIDKKKKTQPVVRTTKAVFLRLPNDLHKDLKQEAKRRKLTIQKHIIRILDTREK